MPGRTNGAKNYKNDKLLDILSLELPTGAYQWKKVAEQYKLASGEDIERDPTDIKSHFLKKLCNNGQKPTGVKTLTPIQDKAVKIYAAMQRKEAAGTYAVDNEDEVFYAEEEEQEEEEEEIEDANEEEFEMSPSSAGGPVAKRPKLLPNNSSSSSSSVIASPTGSTVSNQKSKNVKVYNANSKRAGAAGAMKDLVQVLRDNGAQQQFNMLFQAQQQQLDRAERDRERYEKERERYEQERERQQRENRRLMSIIEELRTMIPTRQKQPAADNYDLISVANMPTQDFN
jgi:TATA-binding protein-associated factor Taf7